MEHQDQDPLSTSHTDQTYSDWLGECWLAAELAQLQKSVVGGGGVGVGEDCKVVAGALILAINPSEDCPEKSVESEGVVEGVGGIKGEGEPVIVNVPLVLTAPVAVDWGTPVEAVTGSGAVTVAEFSLRPSSHPSAALLAAGQSVVGDRDGEAANSLITGLSAGRSGWFTMALRHLSACCGYDPDSCLCCYRDQIGDSMSVADYPLSPSLPPTRNPPQHPMIPRLEMSQLYRQREKM